MLLTNVEGDLDSWYANKNQVRISVGVEIEGDQEFKMGSWEMESCVPKETESSKWDLGVRYVPQTEIVDLRVVGTKAR